MPVTVVATQVPAVSALAAVALALVAVVASTIAVVISAIGAIGAIGGRAGESSGVAVNERPMLGMVFAGQCHGGRGGGVDDGEPIVEGGVVVELHTVCRGGWGQARGPRVRGVAAVGEGGVTASVVVVVAG